ncbi:MAG: peptidoglycan LD-endopeptidase LytH [Acidobacteriota bacterium]|nr:peptidoglycan LD-endopeptidase LytH [Acidobacteriota bacterium]
MAMGPRTRVLLIAAIVFAALAALVWSLSYHYWSQPVTPLRPPTSDAEQLDAPSPAATQTPEATSTSDANATPTPSPTPQPTVSPNASPRPNASPLSNASPANGGASPTQAQASAGGNASSELASMRLLIPVEGIGPGQLQDTFNDARSEGRVHDAIDIMAPRGTPVLAASDGPIVKLFQSVKGGTTLYQLASADEHLVFYYAHLERYADGLAEGHVARRGETIGYVGDTGNAGPGNTHLHFQIYRVADPKHFWTGDNINPYPILRATQ